MTDAIRPSVLQVVLSLSPGGTERLVIDLATRLQGQFRMAVCCLDAAGEWADELRARDVAVEVCERRPGFHPALGARIAAVARRHHATVLHCHHYSPLIYGALALRHLPGGAVVFTEHGRLSADPPSLKRRVVNRLLLARVPVAVCAVSDDLAGYLRLSGFSARRIDVVHNGIDPGEQPGAGASAAARRRLALPDDAFVAMTIARADPVKDLSTMMEAFAELVERVPSSRLVVVGDGPERSRLEQVAAARGIAPRVCFAGARDRARDLLPAADVYLNSSITEGVSLTILEAMAARLPVVATAVGGTPDVVVHRTTGLLVPPRNAAALGAAAAALALAPVWRDRMGAAARSRVVDAFTLDRMVARYAAAYDAAGSR